MDESLNYILPPVPLTQLCTAKIAITMLNSLLENKSARSLTHSSDIFKVVRASLIEDLQRVKVPGKFASYLQNYLIFVVSNVRSWFWDFEKICNLTFVDTRLTNQFLGNIAWTGRGEIDQGETARLFVTNGNLSLDNRYRLACTFYLEDLVRRLWTEMPPEYRLCNDVGSAQRSIESTEKFEVAYWSFQMMEIPDAETFKYIQKQLNEMTSEDDTSDIAVLENYIDQNLFGFQRQRVYVYAFAYSLFSNKSYSARYFAAKCDEHHRVVILKSLTFNVGNGSDDFDFVYLSLMDRKTVQHIFEKNEDAYQTFLHIPSELFVRCFKYFKSFIDEERFYEILMAIAVHDTTIKDDYISPLDIHWSDIFKELWLNEVTESYRKYILNKTTRYTVSIGRLLSNLFNSSQLQSVDILLDKLPETQRRVLCAHILPTHLLCGVSKWKFLRYVFARLVTSGDDLQYLKGLASTELSLNDKWNEILVDLENSVSRKRKFPN